MTSVTFTSDEQLMHGRLWKTWLLLLSVHSVNHYLALIVCQTLNDVLEIQQRRKCRPDFLPPESQGLVRDTKNKGMNSKHNRAYDKNKTKNSSRAKTGIL